MKKCNFVLMDQKISAGGGLNQSNQNTIIEIQQGCGSLMRKGAHLRIQYLGLYL